MRSRSRHGGQHELGQNYLHHLPTIRRIVTLVRRTEGSILEIGAGDGALTRPLAELNRPVTAIELDEHRADALRRALPRVDVRNTDALRMEINHPIVVGNIPFHLTTPLLRALLRQPRWERAVLLTQWEVARKRAGVGGGTMMTAQHAPWFEFRLEGRVPAHAFRPTPVVDGGLLVITRRNSPLIPVIHRKAYQRFVHRVFTARGRGLRSMVRHATRLPSHVVTRALRHAAIPAEALPRSVEAEQWATLWSAVQPRRH